MPADSGLERGFHNEIDLYAEQFAQMLSKRCKQPSQQAVGHSVRRLIGLRNHNNTTIIGTRRCVYRHPTLRLLTKNHILRKLTEVKGKSVNPSQYSRASNNVELADCQTSNSRVNLSVFTDVKGNIFNSTAFCNIRSMFISTEYLGLKVFKCSGQVGDCIGSPPRSKLRGIRTEVIE